MNSDKIITDLKKLPFAKNSVTLVCGSLDLLHVGHVKFLEKCKEIGNPLVVAIWNDDLCKTKKPNRPIISQNDRAYMVASLECVDWVYICETAPTFKNGLLYQLLQPKVVVFSTGEESNHVKSSEYNLIESSFPDTQIVEIPRQRYDISTTQIIAKILLGSETPSAPENPVHLFTISEIESELNKLSLQSNASQKNAALILNDKTKQLMAVGYNYHPSISGTVEHKNIETLEYKQNLPRPMHAEMSAMIEFLNKYHTFPDEGYTLYTTSMPCAGCAEFLARVKMQHIRYFKDFDNNYGLLIDLTSGIDIKKI